MRKNNHELSVEIIPGVDEPPYCEVDLPPVVPEVRLDLYRIYREMGGDPFEPNESLFRAKRLSS